MTTPKIIVNLRHAAARCESVVIGGGRFEPEALIEAAALIEMAARTTYVHFGRRFKIVAEFEDTPEGTAAANAYMTANPDAAVLAVGYGRVILANVNDKGIPA